MMILDIFREVIGSINRNRMRSIATGFAVSSGLFLIIVLQGAGNGIIHTLEYNMGGMSFDAIHVFGGMTTRPFEGVGSGRWIQLDDRDVAMTRRRFGREIANVFPSIEIEGVVVSYEAKHINSSKVVGVYPQYQNTMSVKLLHGRFVNNIDLQHERKVVCIGNVSAKNIFRKGENPIGKVLNISGICYTIVGVYKTDEQSMAAEFYAPFSTLTTIYNRGRSIDQMTMTIRDIPTEQKMKDFIGDYVRSTSYIHSFDPEDREAMWIWNQAENSITMSKTMDILHTSFWILGLLTLVSGIVGVSNIMLISVKERIREFGIRRAIGARPWNIINMVMLESIVITGIFGYIGMFLGIMFCEWMDMAIGGQTLDIGVFQTKYFLDPTVDLGTCVTATVIIIVSGALAGFFPARRAVKIKAIEALRG